MFHRSQKYGSTRQQELEVDYMARALLMPLGSIQEELVEYNYDRLSVDEREHFAWYISKKYQVPIQHAVQRIKEVLSLNGGYIDNH